MSATTTALGLQVFTSPTRPIGGGQTFSPITSTLISGDDEAVLVDCQFVRADVDALGDMIEATGKTLTTIFVTHGHGDHCFGGSRLMERFPAARFVATAGVVSHLRTHLESEVKTGTKFFGDELSVLTTMPEPLDGDVIDLEGHQLRVIDVGQGDIAPSAVLHIPALEAVVAGDIAYNQIHQMLGLSGPTEWAAWIDSVRTLQRLDPRVVIAGHRKPEADDDGRRVLAETRSYIEDFTVAFQQASSMEDIVEAMHAKYPHHGNPTTLHYSAYNAIKRHKPERH
ncbi:MBL fold metallo-hydrolase [Mycobacterium sp. WMMD1722]|uniref:MBL fold metallo-hydrolase n=1 Tax=Mycobacterium sp. WMMD1722 TaxID=3404117 RepID=UPI003BF58927